MLIQRSKSKVKARVGPLQVDANVIADDTCMAELFNNYFVSVFTAEDRSTVRAIADTEVVNTRFVDVTITEDIVKRN